MRSVVHQVESKAMAPGLTLEVLREILVRFEVSLPVECATEILAAASTPAQAPPVGAGLGEDRLDWLANAACPGGVAYPSQVKMAIRSALQEASRFAAPVAAGCIPVKEFIAKQRENPAIAAAMDRVRASLEKSRSNGIFSDFNACMFRDECRTRAAALALTDVDEIMRIAQMAEGARTISNPKDSRNLIEDVCDALSAILKRQSDASDVPKA